MKFISRLNVGTRLALACAVVLVLMIAATAVGVWQLHAVADTAERMMEKPLTKERMVSDWYRNIFGAVRRTAAIAKSSDDSLGKFFEKDIVTTAKDSAELQKAVTGLLSDDPQEKALFEKVNQARAKYSAARDAIVKFKKEGNAAEAQRVLDEEFVPYSQQYEKVMLDYLNLQRKAIDDGTRTINAAYHNGAELLIALAVLGVLLGAVCAFIIARSIIHPLGIAVNIATRVAAGDLTGHIEVRSSSELGRLMQALKTMNEKLVHIVTQVRNGTEAIATGSGQIAAGNHDLSARTEQQASSLEETASSMEELTSTVKQNADNARQANQLAEAASGVAVKGGEVVSQVVETMDAINASSKRIVDIISVIDGIAFQTNILALNAAVEAARAGEQGRGFAVVAAEVRTLAQRSAAAAKEIKELIDDSVEKVDTGAKLVGEAGSTMHEIVESVKRVTDIMSEISAASAEQTAGIEQVNQAIAQMDEVTQQNASLVEEAAAASQSLQDQAGSLARIVSVFKLNGASTAAAPAVAAPAVPATPRKATVSKPAAVSVKSRAAMPARATQPRRIAPAHTRDDDWEEF